MFPVRMNILYILQLADNKWYVGKTTDATARFKQHVSGSGSAWTTLYKPIKMVESRPLKDAYDETNTTKDLMKKYGIDNVRGGAYVQPILSEDVEKVLKQELRGDSDTCFKCGLKGHFANKCPVTMRSPTNKPIAPFVSDSAVNLPMSKLEPIEFPTESHECSYCDRTFTTKYGCSVHERSCKQDVVWQCPHCPTEFPTKQTAEKHEKTCGGQMDSGPSPKTTGSCYRCGRKGHWSPDCYASRHVKGYDLDD
jgi:predicted GIY-YIG superfamily endonuclease